MTRPPRPVIEIARRTAYDVAMESYRWLYDADHDLYRCEGRLVYVSDGFGDPCLWGVGVARLRFVLADLLRYRDGLRTIAPPRDVAVAMLARVDDSIPPLTHAELQEALA